MQDDKKSIELRRGVLVFAGLAVLTAIEYWIGVIEAPVIFLWAIAIIKAALVLIYFMHVSRVFRPEGEEH
jgi:cytochrome c oxidase subunit 4